MYDVVIIGAGAAGLMAAGVAARKGKSVLLIEKMEKAGRKIRITGKGRCNLTNTKPREEFLRKIRANAEFFAPSFDDFDNQATIAFFQKQGVKLSFERGDRVFPESGKAWDIADALVRWAERNDVKIEYKCRAEGIRTIGNKVNGVRIVNKNGFPRNIECENVIVCTGGASYPATGSTGDGYEMAYNLGHSIVEVRPSLVPLESDSEISTRLAGLHLKNVAVKLLVNGDCVQEEFGEMDFGSRGIEGSVILRLSRKAVDALIEEKRVAIAIDLKAALTPEVIRERIERERNELPPVAKAGELLRKLMPRQLVSVVAEAMGIKTEAKVNSLTNKDVDKLISILKDLTIPISDYRPFEEAVVTAGGVSVEDINPYSLESGLIRGLFFAGEVLDIDADTGGYNLQIAFSTGHLAGQLKQL